MLWITSGIEILQSWMSRLHLMIKLLLVQLRGGDSLFGGCLSVLSSIKGSHCFVDQETILSLLSTGWFQ
mgnify:FL=1